MASKVRGDSYALPMSFRPNLNYAGLHQLSLIQGGQILPTIAEVEPKIFPENTYLAHITLSLYYTLFVKKWHLAFIWRTFWKRKNSGRIWRCRASPLKVKASSLWMSLGASKWAQSLANMDPKIEHSRQTQGPILLFFLHEDIQEL